MMSAKTAAVPLLFEEDVSADSLLLHDQISGEEIT
jgi:hypothetical protein